MGGGVYSDPPTGWYNVTVGDGTDIVFRDEMEEDVSKWSVSNSGGLTTGAWERVDPNGTIARKGLQAQLDWYRTQGTLKVKKGLDEMIDESFVKNALQKLGRVDVK